MLWIVEAVIWTVMDDPDFSESSSVLAAKNSLWILNDLFTRKEIFRCKVFEVADGSP